MSRSMNTRKTLISRVERKKHKEDGRPTYRFLATNEEVDRQGDILRFQGWDTDNFEKNPTILWAHSHSELPIGKGQLERDDKKKTIFVDIEFASADNPFAALVERMVDKGFVNAVSVGFVPKGDGVKVRKSEDGDFIGFEFTSQDLLEISLAPVGVQQNALRELSFSDEERELMVTKGLFSGEGLTGDSVEALVKSIQDLTEYLKTSKENVLDSTETLGKLKESIDVLSKSVGEGLCSGKPKEPEDDFSDELVTALKDLDERFE